MDPDPSPALRTPENARAHLQFPTTSWDLLADVTRAKDHAAGALNEFAERYYAAVRAFIAAVSRTPLDADDLTQRFFETVVLTGRLLAHADREKGSFRPYLKQSIRNFLVDEHRRRARSINVDVRPDAMENGWNAIVADTTPRPEEEMLRAWAQSLVAMAVARLEALCAQQGQQQHFQLFMERYVRNPDDPPSWRQIGEPFGLPEKIARGRAETAARHFRTLLRQLIASDIGSEDGIDEELQAVIAVL